MKLFLLASLATAIALPALAQPSPDPAMQGGAMGSGAQGGETPDSGQAPTVSSTPIPNSATGTPGIPGDQAVNPAPGATGAYVGHSQNAFYDVDARIGRVEQRVAALPAGQRRKAMVALKSIRAEEKTQVARHHELRDWDREHLNYRLDQLVGQYASLGPSSNTPAPGPEQ